MLLAANSWVAIGLLIVFTFYNVNASLAAGVASAGKSDVTHAVSNNATFRDAGPAFGALAGGFLLTSDHLQLIYIAITLLLLFLTWVYYKEAKVLLG